MTETLTNTPSVSKQHQTSYNPNDNITGAPTSFQHPNNVYFQFRWRWANTVNFSINSHKVTNLITWA